jgi:2'-5' RNA ligase
MKNIRTFIAIKIPNELEDAFGDLIRQMRKLPGDVRWVNPHSIHLTLKFLGEITPEQVRDVCAAMEKAATDIPKFALKTGLKGAFPSLKRPRVFWVGLTEMNNHYLLDLQKNVEDELAGIGFPKEKRTFKPHLTVGRVKNSRGIEKVTETFMNYQFPEIEFSASEILVMKSELTPKGAIYTVQKIINFDIV